MDPGSNWQEAAAAEITGPERPRLRPSGAGNCLRRQYYAAWGHPEEPSEDRLQKNRMALGHMAETLILLAMKEDGWETRHTVLDPGGQPELEILDPGHGYGVITGRCDGLCRHPEWTRNQWVTLECKSMATHRADQVRARGVAEVYPKYIWQAALYARPLYEQGLVASPLKAVFGMMDRDGNPLPPERVSWDEKEYEKAVGRLQAAALAWAQGVAPPRLEPGEEQECQNCPYRLRCQGMLPGKPHLARATALDESHRAWQEAPLWLAASRQKKESEKAFAAAVKEAGGGNVEANGVTAGYFQPEGRHSYDARLLEQRVPKDLLEQCRSAGKETRRLWVRETR